MLGGGAAKTLLIRFVRRYSSEVCCKDALIMLSCHWNLVILPRHFTISQAGSHVSIPLISLTRAQLLHHVGQVVCVVAGVDQLQLSLGVLHKVLIPRLREWSLGCSEGMHRIGQSPLQVACSLIGNALMCPRNSGVAALGAF